MTDEPIRIVPSDPTWPERFEAVERARSSCLGILNRGRRGPMEGAEGSPCLTIRHRAV